MSNSVKKNRFVVGMGIVFLILLLHPLTRPFMLVVLPLGSGIDDVIVVVLFILFIFIWKDIK